MTARNHKIQAPNDKQIPNNKSQNTNKDQYRYKMGAKMKNGRYDLEERTEVFARNVRDFIKMLPKGLTNFEYSKQLIRSSASIGANYIEANEALSKKDFVMRVKIARKECKETRYWLRLIDISEAQIIVHKKLLTEVSELLNILSAICSKVSA